MLLSAITDPEIRYHHQGWTSSDNNYLFITDELSRHPEPDVIVYDVSDKTNPVRVADFGDTTATIHNLFVMDDVLLASYYTAGFKMFDVSDPPNPTLIDHFDTSPVTGETFSGAWGVYPFAPSGRVYISDRETGLHIFELRETPTSVETPQAQVPGKFTLHHNYPNPFNPETIIRFELPEDSEIKLDVFNTVGQKIRTLVDERRAPGVYQVTWDGTDERGIRVSSGIYFYRLKTADKQTFTKSMLMLK